MSDFAYEFRAKNNSIAFMRFSEEGELIGEVEINLERRRDPRNKVRAFLFGDLSKLSSGVQSLLDAKPRTGKGKASPKAGRVDAKRGPGGSVRGDGDGTSGSSDSGVSSDREPAGDSES